MIDSKKAKDIVNNHCNPDKYPVGTPKLDKKNKQWIVPILDNKDHEKILDFIGVSCKDGKCSRT
jgi:hypothetical protein